MTPEYQKVQNSADQLYKALSDLSNHIDRNGANLDDPTKRLLSSFDRETLIFQNNLDLYGKSVLSIKWNGQTTQPIGLVMMLNGVLQKVSLKTGYKFASQKWFDR